MKHWVTSSAAMEDYRNKSRFLYGESMGGAVALLLHRKDPTFWDGAVLVAPMCKVLYHTFIVNCHECNLSAGGCWSVGYLQNCRYQRRWNHIRSWLPSWRKWKTSSQSGRSSRPKTSSTLHSRTLWSAKKSVVMNFLYHCLWNNHRWSQIYMKFDTFPELRCCATMSRSGRTNSSTRTSPGWRQLWSFSEPAWMWKIACQRYSNHGLHFNNICFP